MPYESFKNKFGLKKITEGYGSFQKGIKNNNISNTDKDTFTDKKDFFSYRRNFKNKLNDCGRMISTISMKIQND